MTEHKFKDYRVEPSEVAFKIYATNIRTGREELIKCTLSKSGAYAYIAKKNYSQKHPIHSNRLKVILKELGLTYKDFASKIGKNPNTISNWANNNSQPSYGVVLMMSQALNMPVSEIINF